MVLLYFVVGLDRLISLGASPKIPQPFPASVAGLLILFFVLLLLDWLLPKQWMDRVLKIVDFGTELPLKTMSLYFTPSFIRLPLSPPISASEIGKMIAVFVLGYIAQFIVVGWVSRLLQLTLARPRVSDTSDEKEMNNKLALPLEQMSSGQSTPNCGTRTAMNSVTSLQDTIKDESNGNTAPKTIPKPIQFIKWLCKTPTTKRDPNMAAPELWAETINNNFAVLQWLVLFFLVGVPVYFSTGYTMPIFLAFNVLMFHAANAIPPNIKRVAHPVLMTAMFTIFGIWIAALTEHNHLDDGLRKYYVGHRYLEYFRGASGLPLPGAGDVLSSMLDASIVSLAIPMYQYRRELWQFVSTPSSLAFASLLTYISQIIPITVPTFFLAVPSLLAYPAICYAIGLSPRDSLAFAPRSVTLALAQICSNNLGGNLAVISTVAVVSGISGPIFGPTLLRLIRIPDGKFHAQSSARISV